MIFSTLQELKPIERKVILKIAALSLFQDPPMSKPAAEFILKLCEFSALDDAEITAVMHIDIRDRWDFENLIYENLSLGSQRFLYFLVKLIENCFKSRGGLTSFVSSDKISGFIDKKVSPCVHFSENSKATLASSANALFIASCNAYGAIYSGAMSKKELDAVAPSEKIFMLNFKMLKELPSEEAIHFLSVFNKHTREQPASDEYDPWGMLLKFILGATCDRAELVRDNIGEPDIQDYMRIEQSWVKNLVMTSCMSFLKEGDDPSQIPLVREMAHKLDADAKVVKKYVFEPVSNYKDACVSAYHAIHDVSNKDFDKDSTTEYMKTVAFVADIATDFLPGVGAAKKLYKHSQQTLSVVDSLGGGTDRTMEKILGLRVITEDPNSNVMNICVDGFMTESAKGQFYEWSEAFEILGIQGSLLGFAWPSSNYYSFGAASWHDSVSNALAYGTKLSEDIKFYKKNNSSLKINLYGHSLGARIIHNALVSLSDSECKIENVYLFGGAVSRLDKHRWAAAVNTINGRIYNFYSSNDEILKKLYRLAQAGDQPAGLGDIQYFGNKNIEAGPITNLDVSDLIGGHTEYKSRLVRLLGTRVQS